MSWLATFFMMVGISYVAYLLMKFVDYIGRPAKKKHHYYTY